MKIFCSGIGGIGVSAYASLQKRAGHDVAGSDRSASALIEDLRSQGIRISLDQSGTAMEEGTELLVYSEAVPADAPERRLAAQRGIRQISYPQALGELQRGKRTIAVCGTHGKSSTTGLATRLFLEAKLDPTVVIGTKVRELSGRNWRQGESDVFLLEACEYRRSFLNYDPSIILLTTCDGDHFDYFRDMEDYRSAFRAFIEKLPPQGTLITHLQDAACADVASVCAGTVIDADAYPLIPLAVPGLHMRQNAQLVLGLADVLRIPSSDAQRFLAGYAGSWRRMEVKGEVRGATVIDDYAHHPAEIRATLAALKEAYPKRRRIVIFQPHTHDRTLKLYRDFTGAFGDADIALIADVYVARSDIETARVDLQTFVTDIARESGTDARVGGSLASCGSAVRGMLRSGDVIICMGAGSITTLADDLLRDVRHET